MRYDFKEAQLGKDFAKEKLADFKELIEDGKSFVILSMPGVGVSYFLRYLACQDWAYFIHVDLYSLPALTKHEFYKLLFHQLGGKGGTKSAEQLFSEAKQILSNLSKNQTKVVLIFSRFDQLKKEFDNQFFSNIQSLTSLTPGKIVLIFTSTKPLTELSTETLTGGNLNFFSESLYFKPYSEDDIRKLITLEPPRFTPPEILDKLIKLSGGHNQLLQILRRSQKQQNLQLDQFVKLQVKGLIDYLDYHQRKTLQKIALGKKVEEVDEYLLGVGMVKKTDSKFVLFTPLLSEYIRLNIPVKLPVKEAKLFKLLRSKIGAIVTKDEIFATVWGEGDGGATDWALDALIYRLRKHPFTQSHGYIIESHKKVGYTLIQT